jgi:hypothetical protein
MTVSSSASRGFIILILVLLASGSAVAAAGGGRTAPASARDAYIVQFKSARTPVDVAARIASVGGSLTASLDGAGIAVARLDARGAAILAKDADVAELLPDIAMRPAPETRRAAVAAAPVVAESAADPSGAYTYPWAWNLRVIEAEKAWQAGLLGDPGVRVAIIDTGIDPYYSDLEPLIDVTRSASFCTNEAALNATVHPGYPAWTDLYGHGTWTASIVSSQATKVAGVTTRTTLMAVQVLGWTDCSLSSVLRGIFFATANGADVLNLSLGVPAALPKNIGWGRYAALVHGVVQYALAKGVSAVVVAAGNGAMDLDHDGNNLALFCGVPGVICVSATGPTTAGVDWASGPWDDPDQPAFYTNYGASAISVAAPGGNAAFDAQGNAISGALVWGACAGSDIDYSTGVPLPGVCSGGGYDLSGGLGTSASAPHVAALAALLVSRFGRGSKAQVQAAIRSSADDILKPGVDPLSGAGRINVARALGLD